MKCGACGTDSPSGSKFCLGCGVLLQKLQEQEVIISKLQGQEVDWGAGKYTSIGDTPKEMEFVVDAPKLMRDQTYEVDAIVKTEDSLTREVKSLNALQQLQDLGARIEMDNNGNATVHFPPADAESKLKTKNMVETEREIESRKFSLLNAEQNSAIARDDIKIQKHLSRGGQVEINSRGTISYPLPPSKISTIHDLIKVYYPFAAEGGLNNEPFVPAVKEAADYYLEKRSKEINVEAHLVWFTRGLAVVLALLLGGLFV